tara:strand:+ start:1630 stop:1839 length:210 start_codon:yes stop_codon:yes gene_type:complete
MDIKQHQDELGYYTDFEGLEVNLNDDPNELYDSSDDNMVERDHLDILEFCSDLESYEYLDDAQFNYMEV